MTTSSSLAVTLATAAAAADTFAVVLLVEALDEGLCFFFVVPSLSLAFFLMLDAEYRLAHSILQNRLDFEKKDSLIPM